MDAVGNHDVIGYRGQTAPVSDGTINVGSQVGVRGQKHIA
jgi:hypothetical protein